MNSDGTDDQLGKLNNGQIKGLLGVCVDKPVASLVRPFNGEKEITEGIKMIHTGGHSDGHAIIIIEDGLDRLIHMADIMRENLCHV